MIEKQKNVKNWYIYGKPREIVDQFAYLGIFFLIPTISWAAEQFAEQERKAYQKHVFE